MSKDLLSVFNYLVVRSDYALKEQKAPFQVLFCLFDAGETHALLPVITELNTKQISFKILALGTAFNILYNDPLLKDSLLTLTPPKFEDRFQAVDENWIQQQLGEMHFDILMTGMVSQAQFQLCKILSLNSVDIIAYYDAFAPLAEEGIQSIFIPVATQILVPSPNVAESLVKRYPEYAQKIHIVGQPSIETWLSLENNDHGPIEGIDSTKPTLLFVGGYGHEYEKAFQIFSESVPELLEMNFLMALHPKTDGSYEKSLLGKYWDRMIMPARDIPTKYLVSKSDVILTIHSTVGVQAAFLNKPVIYIHTEDMNYTSIALDKGWASKVISKEELLSKINEVLNSCVVPWDRFDSGGIPKNASTNIYEHILPKWHKNRTVKKTSEKGRINPFASP